MSKNLGNIMKQAQKMQEKMAKVQEEVSEQTVEASAGGGMVNVVVNGKNELISIGLKGHCFQRRDQIFTPYIRYLPLGIREKFTHQT